MVPEVRSRWCCGRPRWHLTPSRFPSPLFPEGPVCLKLTVLGTHRVRSSLETRNPSLTRLPLEVCLRFTDLMLESP